MSDSDSPPEVLLAFKTITAHTIETLAGNQALAADVVFNVRDDKTIATSVTARLQLSAGGDLVEDVLEVQWPAGYAGPRLRQNSFREAAESYVRLTFGPNSRIFVYHPGAILTMIDKVFHYEAFFYCATARQDGGW